MLIHTRQSGWQKCQIVSGINIISWIWLWMESGSLLWKSMSQNNQLLHAHRPHAEWTSRIQHFLTRCGDRQRRRLLHLYLYHITINIMWPFDNMTARHYLRSMVSHLHVVQLRDPFPANTNQNHCHLHQRQADSTKQTACHWSSQSFSEDKVLAWTPTECSRNTIPNDFFSKCKYRCCVRKRTKNLILRQIGQVTQSDFGAFVPRILCK